MKRPKRPGEGRPPVTVENSLPPNWKKIIYNGSIQGKTISEIMRDICISNGKSFTAVNKNWYRLKAKDQEFRDAVNSCLIYRKAWWEEQGRKSLKRRYFQDRTWAFIMKNNFGYTDKMEVDHGITDETYEKYKAMTVGELKEKLQVLLPAPE